MGKFTLQVPSYPGKTLCFGKPCLSFPTRALSPQSTDFPHVWDKGDIGVVPFRARPGHPARARRMGTETRYDPGSSSLVAWLWDLGRRPFRHGCASRVGGSRWHPLLQPEPHGTRGYFGLGCCWPWQAARLWLPAHFQPHSHFWLCRMLVPSPVSLALGQTSARCRCLHPLAVARRATGLSCTPWAARFGVQPGAPSSSGSPKPQDFGAGRASRGSSKLSNLQPGACREQPGRAWAPPDLGGLWAAPHPKRGAGCCGWKHSGPS